MFLFIKPFFFFPDFYLFRETFSMPIEKLNKGKMCIFYWICIWCYFVRVVIVSAQVYRIATATWNTLDSNFTILGHLYPFCIPCRSFRVKMNQVHWGKVRIIYRQSIQTTVWTLYEPTKRGSLNNWYFSQE